MGAYHLQTGFFPGNSGSIHLSVFIPLIETPSRWVIHFPAFAEEMNRSRALVARTARGLAERGVAVVVPDLFGTGDSAGDFVDADWAIWLADQLSVADWARKQGASELVFWGLRAGCLLAAEAASRMITPPTQLVFWQPASSGKQLMTQFLRLRLAASLRQGDDGFVEHKNVAQLRDKLLTESSLRVAGYQLGAGLFQAIESRQLNDFATPTRTRVSVWEVISGAGIPGSRVIQKQLAQWREGGVKCTFSQVQGDPFWSTQELGLAQALTDETVAILGIEYFRPGRTYPELTGLSSSSSQSTTSLSFHCGDSRLVGIVHAPSGEACETGVVIVVGGPQYRIGSHRQFLSLASAFASEGYAVLRFDYRGMGDSEGVYLGFENINEDIRSAIDALQAAAPSVKRVVLWGLCDAATASVCFAPSDERVNALVLANPWVSNEQGAAKAYLKHYYLGRLLSKAFWAKLLSGQVRLGRSLASIVQFLKTVSTKSRERSRHPDSAAAGKVSQILQSAPKDGEVARNDLAEVFAQGLAGFSGSVLLIISGNDLTAAEFSDATRSNSRLQQALAVPLVQQVSLPGVDHTFSRPEWRREVEASSLRFIRAL